MKTSRPDIDELFMMECITLAKKGGGYVSPNPMVGAVLVKRGKVIGRGYHRQYGGPHAEVDAIRSATTSVRGATIYVNLEPCNYFGKTPPCTELLIKSGISKVVIGCRDSNPLVAGKGTRQLRNAGIKTVSGVLESECKKLNEVFEKFITTRLPFVTLKIAQTLDGKIADILGNSKWISNSTSRMLVHYLRSQYDAVLVGAGTVKKDNPFLTVRYVKGRNPIRAVIDGDFSTNPEANIFSSGKTKTLLFISKKSARINHKKKNKLISKGVDIVEMETNSNGTLSFHHILRELGSRNIASVFVEGGAGIFSALIKEKLADKVLCFIAPKIFGPGLNAFDRLSSHSIAKHIHLDNVSIANLKDDLFIEAYLKK
jgi:diaminohydroxyphosphoribosylaminopyrimidine deaminase/5-amino-6-(5-phosphoribosylamino)uracil reductase